MEELIVGKPALLVIDMQHDFLDRDAPCRCLGAQEIIAPIAEMVSSMKRASQPVIWTRELHRPGGIDAGRESDPGYPLRQHTIEGTHGAEIIEELSPEPADLCVSKRRYNCFLGTDLELILNSLKVETLLITGVTSTACVHWTVGEAFQRDYHVRTLEDCVAGTTREAHEASLLLMRQLVTPGRRIMSRDVLGDLSRSHART